LKTEIAEGLLWVCRQPFLRAAVGVIGGINLVFNALALVLVVHARDLAASPALIGESSPSSGWAACSARSWRRGQGADSPPAA
jgi:hypothetical protein